MHHQAKRTNLCKAAIPSIWVDWYFSKHLINTLQTDFGYVQEARVASSTSKNFRCIDVLEPRKGVAQLYIGSVRSGGDGEPMS